MVSSSALSISKFSTISDNARYQREWYSRNREKKKEAVRVYREARRASKALGDSLVRGMGV